LQGIGCFDGMFDDFEVINNLIITNQYNGITFRGLRNSRIINNTVYVTDTDTLMPFIAVKAHKNGTKSSNCIVANNIAATIDVAELDNGIVVNNAIVKKSDASTFFVDWVQHNFHLKSGTNVVRSGNSKYAPRFDIEGVERDSNSVSVGAYQYVDGVKGFQEMKPDTIGVIVK
jgi:hypothetical protein